MNLFLVIIALLLIVCIDHEVRINRLENDNDIIEGLDDLLAAVILLLVGVGFPVYLGLREAWKNAKGEQGVAGVEKQSIRNYP